MISEILLIAFASYGFYHSVQMLRAGKLNFKPFNCRICLSFWFSLIISIIFIGDYMLISLYPFASTAITHILGLAEEKIANDNL